METGRGGAEASRVAPVPSPHAAPTQPRAETLKGGTETSRKSWEPNAKEMCAVLPMWESGSWEAPSLSDF